MLYLGTLENVVANILRRRKRTYFKEQLTFELNLNSRSLSRILQAIGTT